MASTPLRCRRSHGPRFESGALRQTSLALTRELRPAQASDLAAVSHRALHTERSLSRRSPQGEGGLHATSATQLRLLVPR